MTKKKSRKSKNSMGMGGMMKMGMGAYGSTLAVGALPSMGISAADTVKTNFGSGMEKFSAMAFPASGTMLGTTVVLGQAKKLMGATRDFSYKSKKRRK